MDTLNEDLSIDELLNSSGIETNMLQTRENIILCLAPHVIHTEIIHQHKLLNFYLWKNCYTELYEHVCNNKKINIKEIFDKTKKKIELYKLEKLFPENIYEWETIDKFTKNIDTQNKLLIPKRLLIKIKDQDFKTQKFIEKVNNILDKYNNCLTLNFDQLIEFKEIFQLSDELTNTIIV